MKVVIDTNLFISLLLGRLLQKLIALLQSENIKLVISPRLFEELLRVISKPKFRDVFSKEDIKTLVALLERKAIWVRPSKRITDCRDPKDNIILECAVEGNAKVIITGDKDLLVLHPYKDIKILTYKSFQELIRKI